MSPDTEFGKALHGPFRHLYFFYPCQLWPTAAPFHKLEQQVFWAFRFAINAAIGEVLRKACEAEQPSLLLCRGTVPNALNLTLNINLKMFIHKLDVKVGRCFDNDGIRSEQFRRLTGLIFIKGACLFNSFSIFARQ